MSRFISPASLDEALEALSGLGAKPLAGGTDLMIVLRQARLHGGETPETIVDLSRLDDLKRYDLEAERPYLGAGLTFGYLENDPKIKDFLPVLSQAAASVGSVQVRHTATIGGNVANASPAADGTTALTALGARAVIASQNGKRLCPISEVITAPGKNSLQDAEIILGFELDRLEGHKGQVFAKVGRRQAVSIARLNLAVCLDAGLEDPRVVLGACFPSPRRLTDVEELITAGEPGEELWQEAGRSTAGRFVDVCGWRSSADYKVPAIARMMARALSDAWAMVGGGA